MLTAASYSWPLPPLPHLSLPPSLPPSRQADDMRDRGTEIHAGDMKSIGANGEGGKEEGKEGGREGGREGEKIYLSFDWLENR